jgi:hypothetical protein
VLGFVDESLHRDAGLYILSCVTIDDYRTVSLRAEIRQELLLPGQKRFHWRGENAERRTLALELLAEVHDTAYAYVCSRLQECGDGRARALCFKKLMWDARMEHISGITFESRQPHNDQIDRATIIGLQRSRIAPSSLVYDFKTPVDEPLLWLPDVMAGAIAASTTGNDLYADSLEGIRVKHRWT